MNVKDDLTKLLEDLQEETIRSLLQKVKSGEATASDLNVARQMLKDNNISSIPKAGSPLNNLASELPFTGDDEDSVHRPN